MRFFVIIIICIGFYFKSIAEEPTAPDFIFGNAAYYNIDIGESLFYSGIEICLLKMENQYNSLKVGDDTVTVKVSRRSLPLNVSGLRIFVADNKNVKSLTSDSEVHHLLNKDALICVSDFSEPLLNKNDYVFPVNFNSGFTWSCEEESYLFSFLGLDKSRGEEYYRSYEGIGFDMTELPGYGKHWIAAMENSTVVWIKEGKTENEACILLESDSQPGIYYVYDHLDRKSIDVNTGQKMIHGEVLGNAYDDSDWKNFQFAVVKTDSVPDYSNRFRNVVNFFPQIFELYFGQSFEFSKTYTKGHILFGLPSDLSGNREYAEAFEEYTGKGWLLGKWNPTEKVEWVSGKKKGNVRLRKELFSGTNAACENPENYFEYELNVPNGTYRIRANLGDIELPSWQKITFEGISAGTFELKPGELTWTGEKIVIVEDRKLTVRIYLDEENNKVAGLSEIVFQKAL